MRTRLAKTIHLGSLPNPRRLSPKELDRCAGEDVSVRIEDERHGLIEVRVHVPDGWTFAQLEELRGRLLAELMASAELVAPPQPRSSRG